MIQLSLTTEGLSAKTRNSNLIFTNFVAGSGSDENGQAIQTAKQIVPVSFSQVYNKGQQYTLDGITYTEQIDHVKIMGNIQSIEASEDYNLTEIALKAKEGENGTEFFFAYGSNSQETMLITPEESTSYSIIVDIVFDTAPTVTIQTTETGVTYTDLINHINTNVTDTAHGIKYENQDLKINGVSLDTCKNNIFQKTLGVTVYDTLPTASILYDDKLAYSKETVSLYKCTKTTELEVGDYIYEVNNTWNVGDGTEDGALEVIADNTTPAEGEITLSQAQNHFMQWNSVNNIDKRLSLVENVSLGGITDIIDTLQNQITSINNTLANPFPAWTKEKNYVVGDICIANTFKSYQYLECIQAGESDLTIPAYADVGQLVTDNEVKWIVCDWRDSQPVGSFRSDMIQRAGWLKANGATVNRVDYPRLWAYAVSNSLTTNDITNNPGLFGEGDGVDTFTLPNFEDYFIRYSYTRGVGTMQVSQMASHTHTCQDHTGSHDHTSGNQSANHSHSCGNQDTSHTHTINDKEVSHNHSYTRTDWSTHNITIIGGGLGAFYTPSHVSVNTGNHSIKHNHTAGNQSASHKHSIGNQSASHNHTINSKSITHKHTINSTGSGSNTYPTNLTMQMYIKY